MAKTDESARAGSDQAVPERPGLDVDGSRIYAVVQDGTLVVTVCPADAELTVVVRVDDFTVADTGRFRGPRGRHRYTEERPAPAAGSI